VKRGGSDLQHPDIAATEILCTLAETSGVIQQATAIVEQLLALTGQQQATSDPIEQPQAELRFKIADVPGQSGLGDAQVQRRLRDGAQFGDRDEGSYVPQVHTGAYARSLLNAREIKYWTDKHAEINLPAHIGRRACGTTNGQEEVMKLLPAALLGMLGCGLVTTATADTWPAKPLRAIVPVAAGSTTDIIPRVVFEQLSTQLGRNIIVENRAGAGGTVGTAFVGHAEPDGYTILAHGSALTISPALYPNAGFDPVHDFAAVIPLGISPSVLVVPPDRGWTTVGDLIAAAKAKPGALNFSSVGVGSATHLSAERFRRSAGVDAVHVPFKGGSEAMTEGSRGALTSSLGPWGSSCQTSGKGNCAPLR
jgi:hypothetical protein